MALVNIVELERMENIIVQKLVLRTVKLKTHLIQMKSFVIEQVEVALIAYLIIMVIYVRTYVHPNAYHKKNLLVIGMELVLHVKIKINMDHTVHYVVKSVYLMACMIINAIIMEIALNAKKVTVKKNVIKHVMIIVILNKEIVNKIQENAHVNHSIIGLVRNAHYVIAKILQEIVKVIAVRKMVVNLVKRAFTQNGVIKNAHLHSVQNVKKIQESAFLVEIINSE